MMNGGEASQRPKVLVIASPKGGVSKTSTAVGLLSAALQTGRAAFLVDTDETQKSAATWLKSLPPTQVVCLPPCDAVHLIDKTPADFVIVDTAGTDDPAHSALLNRSDLVVIPMSDSRLDAPLAFDLFRRVERMGRKPRLLFTMMDRVLGRRIEQARGGEPSRWFDTVVPRRVAMKDAAAAGVLLTDLRDGKDLQATFVRLLAEIEECIDVRSG